MMEDSAGGCYVSVEMVKSGANDALIAVVDDDRGVCIAISSLLRSAGYRCVEFGSAQSFLDAFRLREIACILLDVSMRDRDGLDLQLSLGAMNCEIPVIFVTAASDDASRERALRQGALAFIGKPFDDTDLLTAIHFALNKARRRNTKV
jgi:FixJ family two-component response regulator